MRPTIQMGETCLVDLRAYNGGGPKRGDVISFHLASPDKKALVKRVIGLEHDHIAIKGGIVYLNDLPLNEPYLLTQASTKVLPGHPSDLTVPAKCIFLLGDNRESSEDSRQFGVIPLANIDGKVVLISKSSDPKRIGVHI